MNFVPQESSTQIGLSGQASSETRLSACLGNNNKLLTVITSVQPASYVCSPTVQNCVLCMRALYLDTIASTIQLL